MLQPRRVAGVWCKSPVFWLLSASDVISAFSRPFSKQEIYGFNRDAEFHDGGLRRWLRLEWTRRASGRSVGDGA